MRFALAKDDLRALTGGSADSIQALAALVDALLSSVCPDGWQSAPEGVVDALMDYDDRIECWACGWPVYSDDSDSSDCSICQSRHEESAAEGKMERER